MDFELDELKREFLEEARTKVAEMEQVIPELQDATSLERLAYLAHQLKGSGGSYGYQAISDDATEMERLVEEVAIAGGGDVTSTLGGCVTKLRASIERALSELG